jgi:hypothetical protein
MRTRLLLAALAAAAVGCGSSTTPTPIPTSNLTVSALSVAGPATVAPGATAQFTASARMTDGSTQDYTTKVTWRSGNVSMLTITSTGQATGQVSGETIVQAVLPVLRASINVIVIPAGTYRLTGTVTESGLPVSKATVAVTSGTGTGLSALTDSGGAYRIYGVAGQIAITVTKDGYTPVVQPLLVDTMSVVDIAVAQTNARTLAGTYALTITANSGCSVYPPAVALPDELKQLHYGATVTQNGPAFRVDLTGADFLVKNGLGNGFSGRIEPTQISFSLGDGYYTPYPDIIESLGDGRILMVTGVGTLTPTGSDIVGSMSGGIYVGTPPIWSRNFPASECSSDSVQFAFTKQPAAVSRIRR